MNIELFITLGVLALEFALMAFCYVRTKQPADPLKPRLLPYGAIMVFLTLVTFITMAHVVSVTTGHRLEPKIRMKGQNH